MGYLVGICTGVSYAGSAADRNIRDNTVYCNCSYLFCGYGNGCYRIYMDSSRNRLEWYKYYKLNKPDRRNRYRNGICSC